MSKLEKLDLMGVASLAAVTAALLVAWMVTTHDLAARQVVKAQPAVTFTNDGSMKMTVTAGRDNAVAPVAATATLRTASVRASGGPSLEVALPFAFRP